MPSAAAPPAPVSEFSKRLPPFRVGDHARPPRLTSHDLTPSISQRLGEMPVAMDRKAFGRMKKGKLVPEARIDLHGMTQAQAHPALTRFIHETHARQLRLVLVITGKGKDRDEPGPMPVPRGILKHQVPQWLASGVLGFLVLQVTEAHLRHGGNGAYYVYLRRHR